MLGPTARAFDDFPLMTSEVDAAPLLLRPAISSVRAVLLRTFRALVRDDPGPEMAGWHAPASPTGTPADRGATHASDR